MASPSLDIAWVLCLICIYDWNIHAIRDESAPFGSSIRGVLAATFLLIGNRASVYFCRRLKASHLKRRGDSALKEGNYRVAKEMYVR